MKSPGIKARSLSGKLPAPLQAVASTVRLHDPPSEVVRPQELPETPPHAMQPPHTGDHSVFAPVLLGEVKKQNYIFPSFLFTFKK